MINKIVGRLLGGVLSIAVALPLMAPVAAMAQDDGSMMGMPSASDGMRKKRYRYRKRTHRVQVGLDVNPWHQEKGQNLAMDLDLLYGYNLGYLELGPNLGLKYGGGQKFDFNSNKAELALGIWGEGNFIKNTRKKKLVPAFGAKVNYVKSGKINYLLLSPYLAVKLFPASRTGLVFNLGYEYLTQMNNLFKKNKMGLNVALSYVHYFHF